MSKKKVLVIPGPFVPYNDTITLLDYKRLSHLDCDFDVVAIGGKKDNTLNHELINDTNYSKFNVISILDYEKMDIVHNPFKLPYFLYAFFKYKKESLIQFGKKQYDIVYSSSHPGMSHLIANCIKKKNKSIKWVASFSDPIKNSPYKNLELQKNKNILYKIAFKIGTFFYIGDYYEEIAVKNANNLVFICEEQRDFTCSQYDNSEKLIKKSIIVPLSIEQNWKIYKPLLNGVKIQNNKLIATHLGRIYGLRRIDEFLCALKELKDEGIISENEIEFWQFGEIDKKSRNYISDNHLEKLFLQKNKVNYQTAIETMANSNFLLLFDTLIEGGIQPYLPSKIVEYLVTKKPILAISGTNSPAYKILNRYGHQCVLPDKNSIKESIIELINKDLIYEYNVEDFFACNTIDALREIIEYE